VETPQVSFIIPVFNRLDLTRTFVGQLAASLPADLCWEAWLIDDGSCDGTPAYLSTLRLPFFSLRLEVNQGYARAVNRGVTATSPASTILGLLNNDLILAPGWFEPMQRLLLAAPSAGAVGNIQKNPATGLIDHAGLFFDLDGLPTHAHKNRGSLPSGPWRERRAASAACLLVKRAVWDALGGLHEGYRNGMEDIDLCVRMGLAGYRIYVSHESVVGHWVSVSPGRHEHNPANIALFRERCAAQTALWGRREWAPEYFRRYARHWWRINPTRGLLALRLLLGLPPPQRYR